jgi:hypothetical protein
MVTEKVPLLVSYSYNFVSKNTAVLAVLGLNGIIAPAESDFSWIVDIESGSSSGIKAPWLAIDCVGLGIPVSPTKLSKAAPIMGFCSDKAVPSRGIVPKASILNYL